MIDVLRRNRFFFKIRNMFGKVRNSLELMFWECFFEDLIYREERLKIICYRFINNMGELLF